MKIDFSKIEDYYSELSSNKKGTLLSFEQLIAYYESKSEVTVEKLKEVFNFTTIKTLITFKI